MCVHYKYEVSKSRYWMTEEEIIQLFVDFGAILRGHFVYSSRFHGEVYLNKRVFAGTRGGGLDSLWILAEQIAFRIVELEPAIIVSPEHGAIELGRMVAQVLSAIYRRRVSFIPIRKRANDRFAIDKHHRSWFDRGPAVGVEDIFNSGGSMERASLVIPGNAELLAVAGLWNRGGITAERFSRFPTLISLVNRQFDKYEATLEDPCRFCIEGVPVNTDLGHGAEFLARLQASS